jgi:hydroxypyruvate isomerase
MNRRNYMNRRTFSKTLAGTAAGAAAWNSAGAVSPAAVPPYDVSVMLWAIFRDAHMEQKLDKIAEAGYTNAELVGEYHKWSSDEWDRVLAKQKAHGIHFDVTAGLGHGVGNPDHRDALLADIKNELPLMERLGCPAVIVMSGNVLPGVPREVQHQSCIESLKRAAAVVEGKQIAGQPVRLLLENIDPEENPKYYLTSVAEGFEIIRAVDHPQVRFLYDFFHEQISEGNLIEKLKKNIEYTGLVHIADVPGRFRPGTGEINYENIYRTLAELNYRHIVAMEFYPQGDGVSELRHAREEALRVGSRRAG